MTTTPKPMMACGHSANANRVHEDGSKTPSCAICAGITPDAEIVVEGPDLTGRKARCSYFGSMVRGKRCQGETSSSTNLAFFAHHPDREYDEYFDGCYGWD